MKEYKKQCPKCNKDQFYKRIDLLSRATKMNTLCNSCAKTTYKIGVMGGTTEEQRKKMRATKAGFKNWEEYVEKYPKKQFYKREVWKYTYNNNLTILENFHKRGRCGISGAYQIDHIMSINYGWENGIPPQEIGELKNLKMIPWEENRRKGK